MKKLSLLLSALLVLTIPVTAQDRPKVSEKPYAMMQKLAPLAGEWSMVNEYSPDGGKTWSKAPAAVVSVEFRLKGMLLAEKPDDLDTPGFKLETDLSYDQYRDVYRKAVVDDTWGIMDVYEGTLEGDKLVMTNLKSGTTFPMGNGVERAFRLTIKIATPKRMMTIDASDDGGTTWMPAYKLTYSK
ncbi:DUF1579 family protein [Kordiimonas sp.]|uniref:DUF1579 family protein n=1 Tax=Kordiimonas sp. TaxID=1970157 RepID=UPI003A8D0020